MFVEVVSAISKTKIPCKPCPERYDRPQIGYSHKMAVDAETSDVSLFFLLNCCNTTFAAFTKIDDCDTHKEHSRHCALIKVPESTYYTQF